MGEQPASSAGDRQQQRSMYMDVQFECEDVEGLKTDFGVIGISAEIIAIPGRPGGIVIAHYERGRPACKLRDYLESHHCSETAEGKIKTLPVDGWDLLLQASVLH
jgi:hypothetical protein